MNNQENDIDLNLYCTLMMDVKVRIQTVTNILKGHAMIAYSPMTIEFLCLQIRKILEFISMGSLVINRNEFEAIGNKYESYWNAKLILRDIERLNPEFYPIPVMEVSPKTPGAEKDLISKTTGFLTREDFVRVYDKCGKMMHAYNPFGSRYDYDYYRNKVAEWHNQIIGLINSHLIHLKGIDGYYLIHMKEDRDNQVHGYYFKKWG